LPLDISSNLALFKRIGVYLYVIKYSDLIIDENFFNQPVYQQQKAFNHVGLHVSVSCVLLYTDLTEA
jgi:hypothetical protein